MTFMFQRFALAATFALALAGPALASNKPIRDIDIVVSCLDCKPPEHSFRTTTNGDGKVMLNDLPPGAYVMEIDGRSLGTSINRIDPNPKSPDHIIAILVGLLLPAQKAILSTQQPVRGGEARGPTVRFTIPEAGDPGRKHNYIGSVTLVK